MNIKHDKDQVLKTGLQLFCSKGYSSLGVEEICKSSGMTKGAFYNAFKSKENFLLSSIKAYGKNTVVLLTKKLHHSNEKAIDRITKFYEGMFEAQPKNNYTGCMINNIMSELGASNKIVGEATAIEFEHFLNVIEPVVLEAQEEGDFNSHINSRSLTELLHSTFYGALTRAKSLQDYKQGIDTMHLLINSLKTTRP